MTHVTIYAFQSADPEVSSIGGTNWQVEGSEDEFARRLVNDMLDPTSIDWEYLVYENVDVPDGIWNQGRDAVTDWVDEYAWGHTALARRIVVDATPITTVSPKQEEPA